MNTQPRKAYGPPPAETARVARAAQLIAQGAFGKPSLLATLSITPKDSGNERLAG